jgi:hypothetical protein
MQDFSEFNEVFFKDLKEWLNANKIFMLEELEKALRGSCGPRWG